MALFIRVPAIQYHFLVETLQGWVILIAGAPHLALMESMIMLLEAEACHFHLSLTILGLRSGEVLN